MKRRYRSKLEATFARAHPHLAYEPVRLPYQVTHVYVPDFMVSPTRFVECKGLWSSADRSKHLYIKAQHPHIQVLLVFQNPHLTLNKRSTTTYASWCDKHGIPWVTIGDPLPAAFITPGYKNPKAINPGYNR